MEAGRAVDACGSIPTARGCVCTSTSGGEMKSRIGKFTCLLFPVLMTAAGCGTTTVTVRIDALSFISEEDRVFIYGEDPVIPPGGPSVRVTSPVFKIPISGELENVTDVKEVEVLIDLRIENETGYASVAFRIYMAGEDEDPFQTEPLMDEEVEIVPDSDFTASFEAKADERITGLFSGNEIRVAGEVEVDPYGDQFIRGKATMTKFEIEVTGTGHAGSI